MGRSIFITAGASACAVLLACVGACVGTDPVGASPNDAGTPPTTNDVDSATGSPDAAEDAGTDAAVCVTGAKECAAGIPRACVGGAWQAQPACSGKTHQCDVGECVRPPSCRGAAADICAGSDCCATHRVTGGTFNRRANGTAPATVSDYALDEFSVTVTRFRQFVQAGLGTQLQPPPSGAGAHPKIANSGWTGVDNGLLTANSSAFRVALASCAGASTWSDLPIPAQESKPINCVSWHEALAFCAWDGGRLPTLTEWTYAAAGGSEQRPYPWGAGPLDDQHAVYCVAGANQCASSSALIKLVGSLPLGVGRWAQLDLVGNLFEWGLDWAGALPAPCLDCANLTASNFRSVFGGSFFDDAPLISSYGQYGGTTTPRSTRYGFRCARDVAP